MGECVEEDENEKEFYILLRFLYKQNGREVEEMKDEGENRRASA